MPAITVGFPEFESRLDQIRRRINWLALADAACLGGSGLLLAASAVIATAFAFPPEVFTWVLRAASAVSLLVVAGAAWWLRIRWLDMYETAIHVDSSAGMDARVATMLAHPKSESRSPMRSMLLWQIFDLAPLWDVERIAPVRVGRPALAFLAALATFTLTLILVPEAEQEPPPEIPNTATGAPLTANLSPDGSPDPMGGERGSSLRRADPEAAARDGSSSKAPGRGDNNEPQGGTDSGSPGSPKARSATDDLNRPENRRTRPNLENGKIAPPKPERPDDLKPSAPPPPGQQLPKADSRADAPKPDTDTGNKKKSSKREKKRPQPNDKGGSKAATGNPRQGKVGGTKGLLSEKSIRPLPAGENAKPMLIQLKAFAVKPVDQLEPQGKPSGEDGADEADSATQPATLAATQLEDTPIQRSIVTKAHQDLIRELFTPGSR